MTTPTTLRTLLRNNGLYQYEAGHSLSNHGGSFGDFSVMHDSVTTYSRYGVGYRVTRRSTRTGLLRIELRGVRITQNLPVVENILRDNGISFTVDGTSFLVTP